MDVRVLVLVTTLTLPTVRLTVSGKHPLSITIAVRITFLMLPVVTSDVAIGNMGFGR